MKRCRHFWKWVTTEKKMVKADVDKDKCLQKQLRAEHAREFPSLHSHTKIFCVAESIKEFYRKVLQFNARLREDEDFAYSDKMFDNLELFEGAIDKNKEEAFQKYYFARYNNFSKNTKGDHRIYQMHVLDTMFNNFKRVQRNNKIKRERERKRRRKEEEKAKKQAAEEETKMRKAEDRANKQKEKVQRNHKIKQEQERKMLKREEEKAKKQAAKEEMKKQKAEEKAKERKEKQDLLRFQKQEKMEKKNTVKQMKKNIY